MADFPQALDTALGHWYGAKSDFRSPVTSKRGLSARLGALGRVHKTRKEAAAAIGVSVGTLGRWLLGKAVPTPASLKKIHTAHLVLLRKPAVGSKLAPNQMNVKADVHCLSVGPKSKSGYYNSVPHRWFRADRPAARLGLSSVVAAWVQGKSPEQVAETAYDVIKSAYGSAFEFEGTDVTVELL